MGEEEVEEERMRGGGGKEEEEEEEEGRRRGEAQKKLLNTALCATSIGVAAGVLQRFRTSRGISSGAQTISSGLQRVVDAAKIRPRTAALCYFGPWKGWRIGRGGRAMWSWEGECWRSWWWGVGSWQFGGVLRGRGQ